MSFKLKIYWGKKTGQGGNNYYDKGRQQNRKTYIADRDSGDHHTQTHLTLEKMSRKKIPGKKTGNFRNNHSFYRSGSR